MDDVPAFGQADLTNCEREPIHLAGSVQPHGALLVLRETDLQIMQASSNAERVFGASAKQCLKMTLRGLGGDLAEQVERLKISASLTEPVALQCCVGLDDRRLEAAVHRLAQGGLIVEAESLDEDSSAHAQELSPEVLSSVLSSAVRRFSSASTIGSLADAVVQVFRNLTGYDRVMVYKFDPDGHGTVVAEARHPKLESLLGHHYPATDIPQRARELYLRNRARVLVDVNYEPQPIEPALFPPTGLPLDMSLCGLRSMSPLHLQYLKNMGVTGTLVCSLVRDGALWGLVAAHHYEPRRLRYTMRAAAELLAEVASTRIVAIENYAHAQVALMVRRLEHRLVEATSTEGDWQHALFRSPRTLLHPLEATGAALFHDGEMLTAGEVPSTPELRALLEWVALQPSDEPFACASVGKANPELERIVPTASGVLAVRLARSRPDYLMWFRKEQLQTVTWAGNPTKPMITDNPLELTPRRSFAAWSELVRGTAIPWSSSEVVMARAIGASLVDIIVQVQAVRMLIAESQLGQIRSAVAAARDPVIVLDAQGDALFVNDAFGNLRGEDVPVGAAAKFLFTQPDALEQALTDLRRSPESWRRELELAGTKAIPVSVRIEVVVGRTRKPLGFIVLLSDLRESRRADAAREQLEASLRQAENGAAREVDEVLSAILNNASLAAMDIADGRDGHPVAPVLQEVEDATRRAAALYAQIRSFAR